MKIERDEKPPVFDPITITIESVDELKWFLAISNSSFATAQESAKSMGFTLPKELFPVQRGLFDGLNKYEGLCK